MAIQKSEGIVLRRQELRETSLILTFYTRSSGKIKGIIRGVRGPHAQYGGGGLEVFAHDEIVFYERKKSEFYTVSQCDLLEFFNPVRESLDKLAYATYIIELLDSVTALADKNEEVFELLLNSLRLMAGESSAKRVTRIFEIKLLGILGLMPSLVVCANCGEATGADSKFSIHYGGLVCRNCIAGARDAQPIMAGTARFIEHIMVSPFEKVARVKVSADVGRELESILRRFLDYHIERRLRSVQFLKEIEKA